MTADLASLNQVASFEGSEKIKIGNGQGLPIKNIGSIVVKTPSHSLVLKKVLQVPSITVNLMFAQQLCGDKTACLSVMTLISLCKTKCQR